MIRTLIQPWAVVSLALSAFAAASTPVLAQQLPAESADAIYLEEPADVPPPVVVTSGKQQDKYQDTGKMRIEREVLMLSDDQLVNHGTYTEYYPNGNKFAEGAYDHGVHQGQWSFWYDNGQLCKTVTFEKGRAQGSWDVNRADGTLLAKKAYKDNKRDGQWITYHEDGKTPKLEETFVNGLRDGASRAYFANGKPRREVSFKNGELDGQVVEWDESGRKVGEMSFKAGKLDGRFVVYRADGTTIEHTYRDGRLVTDGSQG